MGLEAEILNRCHTVAIVGASRDPERPSNIVARYLSEHGYNIIPVNPEAEKVLGKTSYPDLISVPEKIEVANIFRDPEEVKPIVLEAINIGVEVVWMQEGVINEEAAAMARDAGLLVVMNKCIRREHQRLNEGS